MRCVKTKHQNELRNGHCDLRDGQWELGMKRGAQVKLKTQESNQLVATILDTEQTSKSSSSGLPIKELNECINHLKRPDDCRQQLVTCHRALINRIPAATEEAHVLLMLLLLLDNFKAAAPQSV